MATIPLNDKARLMVESGLKGVSLQGLMELGDIARRLKWDANYDTKERSVKFNSGIMASSGHIFVDNANTDALYAVLDVVRFAWRAQYGNVPGELLEEFEQLQKRVSALEEGHPLPASGAAEVVVLTEPSSSKVTLLPVELSNQRPGSKTTPAEKRLNAIIDQLMAEAVNFHGIVTCLGRQATYLRPSSLTDEAAFSDHQKHQGMRYYFKVPEELETLRRFVHYDRDLLFGRVHAQTG